VAGGIGNVTGRNALAVMWLEHLLVLSMLQHASGDWVWGRYVVVYPADNTDVAAGCARYEGVLTDRSTFTHLSAESMLNAGALPKETTRQLRARYFPGP
jgi:PD-(D/E)XK nuclease superfamily protein